MLPEVIQRMHDVHDIVEASGHADISWGNSMPSRLAARLLGMPPPGTDLPAHVQFIRTGSGEILRRRYGGSTLETLQIAGHGANRNFLLEAFGPVTLVIRLVPGSTGLALNLHRAMLFGLPLPRAFWPTLDASEQADGDTYRFRVVIGLPLVGMIIRYRGSLQPVAPESADL